MPCVHVLVLLLPYSVLEMLLGTKSLLITVHKVCFLCHLSVGCEEKMSWLKANFFSFKNICYKNIEGKL